MAGFAWLMRLSKARSGNKTNSPKPNFKTTLQSNPQADEVAQLCFLPKEHWCPCGQTWHPNSQSEPAVEEEIALPLPGSAWNEFFKSGSKRMEGNMGGEKLEYISFCRNGCLSLTFYFLNISCWKSRRSRLSHILNITISPGTALVILRLTRIPKVLTGFSFINTF